jgi:hypothetical protein
MECKNIAENLYEYIYEELDENTCNEIRKHLEGCENCHSEYEEVKQLLINDARTLFKLKESIEIPIDLTGKVRSSIQTRIKSNRIKYIIAVCLVFMFLYTAPVFAYYAVQIFPFEKYINFLDKDMIKDFKEGRGQVIGKSSTMNGATFTVDGMIKRGSNYNIIFTIKVPKTNEYNYGMPPGGFNIITVQDQTGKKYRVGSASGTSERALDEGEFQYIFEVDEPISFWSFKLNVRITAIELGYTNENENRYFEKYKNIYGNWNVSFYINRSLNQR